MLARTMKPLERRFTMIYLDAPGMGGSRYEDADAPISDVAFVRDIDALRQHLGIKRLWLWAYARGSAAAVHFACQHPSACAGLILVGGDEKRDEESMFAVVEAITRRCGESWSYAEDDRKLHERWEGVLRHTTDEELTEAFLDLLRQECYDEKGVRKLRTAVRGLSLSTAGYDYGDGFRKWDTAGELRSLTIPTVVMVDVLDVSCPLEYALRVHLAVRNSKFVVVDQAGGYPWIEQPDRFFEGLDRALDALGVTGDPGSGRSGHRPDGDGERGSDG